MTRAYPSYALTKRLIKQARASRNTMTISRSGEKADGYVLLTCDEAVRIASAIKNWHHPIAPSGDQCACRYCEDMERLRG